MPRQPRSDSAPLANGLVIYDLDGVITRKDTFTALILRRLRSSPSLLIRALPAAAEWALSRDPDRRAARSRRLAEIALSGMSDAAYSDLARAFGSRIARDPAWMRDETVRRMREQHARGIRIIVATATEERLATALLREARVPYDALSASALASRGGGLAVVDHRVGRRKAEALIASGAPVRTAEFVTDSWSDLPTARLAASVVLVGASARTRERYARAGIVPGTGRSQPG